MPSESRVTCRPNVRSPRRSDLTPTHEVWNACPAELPSTPTLCWVSFRPLFMASDLAELASSPDWGLKNVSIWKIAAQSPPRGSVPCRPTRDCPMLLGVRPIGDELLFCRTMLPLAAGRNGVNGAMWVSYWMPISTTPYRVMPCQVRLSSVGTPGPVFCCAAAGTAPARATSISASPACDPPQR